MEDKGRDRATGEAKPFHPLDLPDELWSRIGKMVVDDSKNVTELLVADCVWVPGDRRSKVADPSPVRPPAIFHTYKALRHELLPYYYSTKIEEFESFSRSEPVRLWLTAVGREGRRFLTNVTIKCMAVVKGEAKERMEKNWGFSDFRLEEVSERGEHGIVVYKVKFL